MTTITVPAPTIGSDLSSGSRERPQGVSLRARIWTALERSSERRASAEIARYLRLHGCEPTGNLGKDLQQLAALRGIR